MELTSGEVPGIHSSSLDGQGTDDREGHSTEDYLLLRADTATFSDLMNFLLKKTNAGKVIETSNNNIMSLEADSDDVTAIGPDVRWIIIYCVVFRWIIFFFKRQIEWFRFILEFFLNGGNLRGFISNFLTGRSMVPDRNLVTYHSVVGHVDTRFVLHNSHTKSSSEMIEQIEVCPPQMDKQALMDLCVMASKVSYENADVVQNTVNKHWKMHLVNFYSFWNEYKQEKSTQVFIMSDKQLDADLILISFRGARAFNADDFGLMFDYSWYHVPGMGKVHVGYLEALGLGTRNQINTIQSSLHGKKWYFRYMHVYKEDKESAYFTLRNMLRSLLVEHPRAKFVMTGHGTGGALAALFPAILLFNEEEELIKRWSTVYTFGQPRIGDEQLGKFMQAHIDKYFRVVYGNDMMPRLPYDEGVFFYKHFGQCLYYNSLYFEKVVKEEPRRKFFVIWAIVPEFVNAVWEFVRGLGMQYMYGEEYKETWLLFFYRVLALVEPAASAHCITNYINCARLGRRDHLVNIGLDFKWSLF